MQLDDADEPAADDMPAMQLAMPPVAPSAPPPEQYEPAVHVTGVLLSGVPDT